MAMAMQPDFAFRLFPLEPREESGIEGEEKRVRALEKVPPAKFSNLNLAPASAGSANDHKSEDPKMPDVRKGLPQ
jgi:hypothetical protein